MFTVPKNPFFDFENNFQQASYFKTSSSTIEKKIPGLFMNRLPPVVTDTSPKSYPWKTEVIFAAFKVATGGNSN